MTRFRIDDSFTIDRVGFVFAGEILEGTIIPGMSFLVPECGHRWRVVVKSIESILLTGGGEKVGLVVENPETGYLPGLGVGWTAELIEDEGG
jgi:hypothetical protein